MESGGVLCLPYGWISQNSFRAWTRQLESEKPAENDGRKTTSQIPRSDLEVCCKWRLFIFEQIFGLEIDVRYVQFLVLFFSRKIGILSFVAKTNWWYAVKIGRLIRFVGCNDGKIHQLVPFTRYRDLVTWCSPHKLGCIYLDIYVQLVS